MRCTSKIFFNNKQKQTFDSVRKEQMSDFEKRQRKKE